MIIYEIHVWMSTVCLCSKSMLVGGIPTPLKNMSSSVGTIIPNIWKHKIHVPNHHFVPLCVAHWLGLGRQCFNCGDA